MCPPSRRLTRLPPAARARCGTPRSEVPPAGRKILRVGSTCFIPDPEIFPPLAENFQGKRLCVPSRLFSHPLPVHILQTSCPVRVPHRTIRAKNPATRGNESSKAPRGQVAFLTDAAAPGRTSRERRARTDATDALGRKHGELPRVGATFRERRRSSWRGQGEASHRGPRSLPLRGLRPAERPRPRCGQVRATTRALPAFATDILRPLHPHTLPPRSFPPPARRRASAPPSPARAFSAHVAREKPAKFNAAA